MAPHPTSLSYTSLCSAAPCCAPPYPARPQASCCYASCAGELCAGGDYDYAVMQSTPVAVSFYERLGFVRVGSLAKYAEKDQDINEVEEVGHFSILTLP